MQGRVISGPWYIRVRVVIGLTLGITLPAPLATPNRNGKEYTYGTPIHVYAPRMKVIQTWVFRRCTLPP